MFCTKCGQKLNNGVKFCENCGQPVMTLDNLIPKPINITSDRKPKALLTLIILACIVFVLSGILIYQKFNSNNNTRTIMIYMVGSDLESESSIASTEIDSIDPKLVDLKNVNILLYTGGTTKWHNFVSNEENAIYILSEDGFKKLESIEQKNMGDPSTLTEFLDYGYRNYKAKHYDVIFYDHGGAIDGAIYDDFTSDNLSIADFNKALKDSKFSKNNKIEAVLFRTCLNGTLEIANVFKDYASYMVASEEVTNGSPFYSVLEFLNTVKGSDDGLLLSRKFINAYDNQMKFLNTTGDLDPMYAIIDLSKVDKVNNELEKYIKGLNIDDNYSDIVRIRSNLFQYAYTYYNDGDFDTVDLYSFVEQTSKYSKNDYKPLLNAINDAVVFNWSSVEDSHGLSIFFPFRGRDEIKKKFLTSYSDSGINSTYLNFISRFNDLYSSNKPSAFVNLSKSYKTDVTDKEFKLELSEEQVNDYAESIYIIFRKEESGKYIAIYSSDNTIIDGNTLTTNIQDNLIKVFDKSNPNDQGEYLSIIERNRNNQKHISTVGILWDRTQDVKNMAQVANIFFKYKNDKPYISQVIRNQTKSNGESGALLDVNKYNFVDFMRTEYIITDSEGNYSEKWENDDIISMVEIYVENLDFEKASLSNGEFYCVFKIYDIYGNYYYSNLQSIQ